MPLEPQAQKSAKIQLSFYEVVSQVEFEIRLATYFWSTAASKSARLLSILKTSFKAAEKDRAIVLRYKSQRRLRHPESSKC